MWRWDTHLANVTAVVLFCVALVLLLLLCILAVFFCRKKSTPWSGEESMLAPPLNTTFCLNDAFDFANETSPGRIEERRAARQLALKCEDPNAEVTLKRLDRSVGHALAVQQLLRDSYVFDTRLLPKPENDVRVIAEKRDYV